MSAQLSIEKKEINFYGCERNSTNSHGGGPEWRLYDCKIVVV
jgi:hypothetical protein